MTRIEREWLCDRRHKYSSNPALNPAFRLYRDQCMTAGAPPYCARCNDYHYVGNPCEVRA